MGNLLGAVRAIGVAIHDGQQQMVVAEASACLSPDNSKMLMGCGYTFSQLLTEKGCFLKDLTSLATDAEQRTADLQPAPPTSQGT